MAPGYSTDLKRASCGNNNYSIFYETKTDANIGCKGIVRAENFFSNLGYSVDVPVTIFFQRKVIDFKSELGPRQVYGYFDPSTMLINMSSLNSPFVSNPEKLHFKCNVKNVEILKELLISLVTHEVAHLFAQHNYNLHFRGKKKHFCKMGHGVQEYIASIVQFSTMDSILCECILCEYEPNIRFNFEEEINVMNYSFDPQKFGVMSYRHYLNQNISQQKNIFNRIFSNQLNPDLVFKISL